MIKQTNVVLTGDCLKVLDRIPANSVHLTFFSPPYDNIRSGPKLDVGGLVELGKKLHRVTTDGGWAIIVIGNSTANFKSTLTWERTTIGWVDEAKWSLLQEIVYRRYGKPGAWNRNRFRVDNEFILPFFKGKNFKTFNKKELYVPAKHAGKVWSGTQRYSDGSLKPIPPKKQAATKCRGTIWMYSTSNTEGDKEKMKHHSTFPLEMARDIIRCFSNPGDLICDPMCGSGTTLLAARQEDRQYIGIDIEPEWIELAKQTVRR